MGEIVFVDVCCSDKKKKVELLIWYDFNLTFFFTHLFL